MKFPGRKFADMAGFFDAYAAEVAEALASVDRAQLDRARQVIEDTILRDGQIFACGNGGSAAIANHLQCDHAKGVSTLTALHPRVQSLSASSAIVTAIGNDLDFNEIFSRQLADAARAGDALIAISASGNSPNIRKALEWAGANALRTISFTGFTGGAVAELAEVNIHVAAENYGVVEDAHQGLLHALAQFVRMSHMDEQAISKTKF